MAVSNTCPRKKENSSWPFIFIETSPALGRCKEAHVAHNNIKLDLDDSTTSTMLFLAAATHSTSSSQNRAHSQCQYMNACHAPNKQNGGLDANDRTARATWSAAVVGQVLAQLSTSRAFARVMDRRAMPKSKASTATCGTYTYFTSRRIARGHAP